MLYNLICSLLLPLARWKIIAISGREHIPADGGCIVAANHVSWLDPLFLTAAIREGTKRRVYYISATGRSAWTQAILPIDKENPGAVLETAAQKLQHGDVIAIFPFGDQRTALEKPKTGAARLARMTGMPLLPVALHNIRMAHTWSAIANFFLRKQPIEIAIGPTFRLPERSETTKETLDQDMQILIGAIASLRARAAS